MPRWSVLPIVALAVACSSELAPTPTPLAPAARLAGTYDGLGQNVLEFGEGRWRLVTGDISWRGRYAVDGGTVTLTTTHVSPSFYRDLCRDEDDTYAWNLGGDSLTLTPLDDPCGQSRNAVLTSADWVRRLPASPGPPSPPGSR
ncbi:MAG: hypothetical protein ACRDI0_04240 [Actinomycetota bacterium]